MRIEGFFVVAVVLAAACANPDRQGTEAPGEPAVKACEAQEEDCAAGQVCSGGICGVPETPATPDAGQPPPPPPADPFQCLRCRTTADCGPNGVCLLDGSTVGGSCGLKCATRTDCPEGNTCAGNEALAGGTVRTCFPATLTCPASGTPLNDGGGTTGGGTTGGGTTGGGTTGGGTTDGGTTGSGTTGGGTSSDPVDMCTPCEASTECGDGLCLYDIDLDAGMCGPTCADDLDCEAGSSCITIGTAAGGVRGKVCFPDSDTCADWGTSTGGGTTGGGTTGGGTTGGGTTGGGTTGGGTTGGVPDGDLCSTCESDADCTTGFCLTDSAQNIGVCGTRCITDASCPSGAECIDIYSGRRYEGSNCFPISETCVGWPSGGGTTGGGNAGVCDFCEEDADCGPGGYCLWDDDTWEGACGSTCTSSTQCPGGTTCAVYEKYEGLFDYVRACFPPSNTCDGY